MDLVHILGSGILASGRSLVLTNYRKWAVKIPTTIIVDIYLLEFYHKVYAQLRELTHRTSRVFLL